MTALRVGVVLFAGDYRAAHHRMVRGEGETYHGHEYALRTLAGIAGRVDGVTVVNCSTPEPFDETLSTGVRVIGAGVQPYAHPRRIAGLLDELDLTHVAIRFPLTDLFEWSVGRRIDTIGVLADSFQGRSLRHRRRHRRLARALGRPGVRWVGNCGAEACRSLARIGVDPEKLIPWGWPHRHSPADRPARHRREGTGPFRLAYAGKISEPKGVGDLIGAVAALRGHLDTHLTVAGDGRIDDMTALAAELGVTEAVEFVGRVAHDEVIGLMAAADAVVIPSRHEYGEGLPFTIFEAMAARTPIVASDHPMIASAVHHGRSGVVAPASDPAGLADAIATLAGDADLYRRLSVDSLRHWEALQVPVRWGDLLEHWLFDADDSWLHRHRLAAGDLYDHIGAPT